VCAFCSWAWAHGASMALNAPAATICLLFMKRS